MICQVSTHARVKGVSKTTNCRDTATTIITLLIPAVDQWSHMCAAPTAKVFPAPVGPFKVGERWRASQPTSRRRAVRLRPLDKRSASARARRSLIHPSVELGPGSGGRAFHSCSHRLHSFPNPKAIPRGLPACLPASRLNKLGGLWSRSVAPTTVMSSSPTLLPTRARPSRLCQAYDLDEVVTYLGWLRGEEGGS